MSKRDCQLRTKLTLGVLRKTVAKRGWQFWIDRGGTFTDVLAKGPQGTFHTHKLLSENPRASEDPTLTGIRTVLGLSAESNLAAAPIESVTLGTTVGTNALLERKGTPTAFLTTEGFGDALSIGAQNRPQLFARHIISPEPLTHRIIEIAERISSTGEVLKPLDETGAGIALQNALAEGAESVAITFVHGWRYPNHETRVAELAREAGFVHVYTSHEVNAMERLVPRGDTTVADAYLSPHLLSYVDRVAIGLGSGVRLNCMQSNGGLTAARRFRGKDSVLSGPAGGVVAATRVSARSGHHKIISFDMGGTSTDVFHFDGKLERTRISEVAGVRLRAPMLSIQTVAAGGGSILGFDGARFRVGPESAGANPGPACYGRGGPLTITDANLLLGRILPESFPELFGPGSDSPLEITASESGFASLVERVKAATNQEWTAEDVANGFLAVAVDNMAAAIKKISVYRGHDLNHYSLCCFGGAGGQHACDVADALGIKAILIHPQSGILSAVGIGLADFTAIREKTFEGPLESSHQDVIASTLEQLASAAERELLDQGIPAEHISTKLRIYIRTSGSDMTLPIPFNTVEKMRRAFRRAHRKRFGFAPGPKESFIAATAEAEATGKVQIIRTPSLNRPTPAASSLRWIRAFTDGAWRKTAVVRRTNLQTGKILDGPALILEAHGTNWVAPGWQGEVLRGGTLLLTRVKRQLRPETKSLHVDPARLEIFQSRFMSVAEQMGAVLENTASSVNIKERLDFSCAIFDPSGGLVANAPHIPVHLGAMPETVKAILRRLGNSLKPGDMVVTNLPEDGGTHLPDVTVVAPVFDAGGATLQFLVGSRAHHADIGGTTPGSMPAHSRILEEEGVTIPAQLLVRNGRFQEAHMRRVLGATKWPARNPDQNIKDLKAQAAACQTGVGQMQQMISQYGGRTVRAYMEHVQENAAESVRQVLDRLSADKFTCKLDDGGEVRAAIRVNHFARSAIIDFTGTSPQRIDNLNAPAAVSKAAVLYVFRCLIGDEIPLNSGCLRPLEIILPPHSLVSPDPGCAVAAGNVETSQVIADTLFAATGSLAASQGTMNNLSFGTESAQYYETLCGGAGAGPGFAGASAVHTHMTNSRLTDVEVLESRFPVVVESFAIRLGSGGGGRWPGGNGITRRLRFTSHVQVSLISGRRVVAPHGLCGGSNGTSGRAWIERVTGANEKLPGCTVSQLVAGDVLVIETPGGGGFGAA